MNYKYKLARRLYWSCCILLCLGLTPTAQACDGGCPVVSSFDNGLFPNYQKHYIGLRARYSSLLAHNGHDGLTAGQATQESYFGMDIQARFYPHRRVQVLTYLPYNYNVQTIEGGATEKTLGFGDMTVLGFYNVYNTNFVDSGAHVQHNLLVGGGLKVPTGDYQVKGNDDVLLSPTLQSGTGAWSFLLSAVYTLRHDKLGLNASATYQINLANPLGYKLGNQFQSSIVGFGVWKTKKTTFVPQLGIQLEQLDYNTNDGYTRQFSGGTQLLAVAGMSLYYQSFQFGVQYQQPIWQKMASGQLHNAARFTATINYLF